ncbi:hypothetical protein TNCV_2328841 [Trichonephila clavipes]|nr:hypothetical protein TNCV_2328841 [Trichonephila clavipes]
MLIQPASSQPGLVRGTVVLLKDSITKRITEQHKWMESSTFQSPCSLGQARHATPLASIEQCYSSRSTALEPHMFDRSFGYLCPPSMYPLYTLDSVDLENPSCLICSEIERSMCRAPTNCIRSKYK